MMSALNPITFQLYCTIYEFTISISLFFVLRPYSFIYSYHYAEINVGQIKMESLKIIRSDSGCYIGV